MGMGRDIKGAGKAMAKPRMRQNLRKGRKGRRIRRNLRAERCQ